MTDVDECLMEASVVCRVKQSSMSLTDDEIESADSRSSMDSRSPLSHSAAHMSTFGVSPVGQFPPAVGKEYILRTMVSRPTPWSRPSPQRMYCVLTSGEFRLAGAFTTDTNFA